MAHCFFDDICSKIENESERENIQLGKYGQDNYGIVSLSNIHLHLIYKNEGSKCIIRTTTGEKLIQKIGGEEKLKKYGIIELQNCIPKLN